MGPSLKPAEVVKPPAASVEAAPPVPVLENSSAKEQLRATPPASPSSLLEDSAAPPIVAPAASASAAPTSASIPQKPPAKGPKADWSFADATASVSEETVTALGVGGGEGTTTRSDAHTLDFSEGIAHKVAASELTESGEGSSVARNGSATEVSQGMDLDGVTSVGGSRTDWTGTSGKTTHGNGSIGNGEASGGLGRGVTTLRGSDAVGDSPGSQTELAQTADLTGSLTRQSAKVGLAGGRSSTTETTDGSKTKTSSEIKLGGGISARIEQRDGAFVAIVRIDASADLAVGASTSQDGGKDGVSGEKSSLGAAVNGGLAGTMIFETEHRLSETEVLQTPLLRAAGDRELSEAELSAAVPQLSKLAWLDTLVQDPRALLMRSDGIAKMADGDAFSYSMEISGNLQPGVGGIGVSAEGSFQAKITGRRNRDAFDVKLQKTAAGTGGASLSLMDGMSSTSAEYSKSEGATLSWRLPLGDPGAEAALAVFRRAMISRIDTLAEDPALEPFLRSRTVSADTGLSASASAGSKIQGSLSLADKGHTQTTVTPDSVSAEGSREVGVTGKVPLLKQGSSEKTTFAGTTTAAGTTASIQSETTEDELGMISLGTPGAKISEVVQHAVFDQSRYLRKMSITPADFEGLIALAADKHDWVGACVTSSVLGAWLDLRMSILLEREVPEIKVPIGVSAPDAYALIWMTRFVEASGANGKDCIERALGRGKFGTSLQEWPPGLLYLKPAYDDVLDSADHLIERGKSGTSKPTEGEVQDWRRDHDQIYVILHGSGGFLDSRAKASMLQRLTDVELAVSSSNASFSAGGDSAATLSGQLAGRFAAVGRLEVLLASFKSIEEGLFHRILVLLKECALCTFTDQIEDIAPLLVELSDLHSRWKLEGLQLKAEYKAAGVSPSQWKFVMAPSGVPALLDPDLIGLVKANAAYEKLGKK